MNAVKGAVENIRTLLVTRAWRASMLFANEWGANHLCLNLHWFRHSGWIKRSIRIRFSTSGLMVHNGFVLQKQSRVGAVGFLVKSISPS